MNVEALREEFRARVCEQVDVLPEGQDRYLVLTPFRHEDGDHFEIILKRQGNDWILTDEASTLMHLSYEINEKDIDSGNRAELIGGSLAGFSVENRGGEFLLPVSNGKFGDALFSFIQALSKVSDITYLSREIVRSTFLEDFKAFLRARVPANRLQFDWYDERNDPKHNYPVDARINHMKRPLFVYALPNDDSVKDATISLLNFERWKMPHRSMAVFEDQETVGRSVLARFTDVCEKAYSSLEGNKERIASYLEEVLQEKR
jgi:hypothetical protein